MKQTAVEQLIEKIQLQYDAAEKEYLNNKSRESYIALRCFELCLKFSRELKEMEKERLKAAFERGKKYKKPIKDSKPIHKYFKQEEQ